MTDEKPGDVVLEILKKLQTGQTEIRGRLDAMDGKLAAMETAINGVQDSQLALLSMAGTQLRTLETQAKTLDRMAGQFGAMDARVKALEGLD